MKDPKSTVRYLGFQSLKDGSRLLNFSFSGLDGALQFVSVEAPARLFSGPDHIAIQECAGICFETLKHRIIGLTGLLPSTISLTSADVVQHRRPTKTTGRPRNA